MRLVKFIQDYMPLVIAQLEIDLGVKAASFFSSANSEWSYSIHLDRLVRGSARFDHHNHEIISKLEMN